MKEAFSQAESLTRTALLLASRKLGADLLDLTYQFLFQSTPPTREATVALFVEYAQYKFQSTPPTRGATKPHFRLHSAFSVSIHAPHAGGDRSRPLRRAIQRIGALTRGAVPGAPQQHAPAVG